MEITNELKLVECPREAWQGLARTIPAEIKADYLRALVAAGFKHIDACGFVSATAVPQMTDLEQVLAELDPPDDVEMIAMALNKEGAEQAARTGAVQTLVFPYSISPTFLNRNQGQTPEECVEALEDVGTVAQNLGLDLVGHISMAFGNVYGDLWSMDEVIAACELLIESGAKAITLADTAATATPSGVSELVGSVIAEVGLNGEVEVGVRLYTAGEEATLHLRAAYEAGCRRFDGTIGATNGYSSARDALATIVSTETLLLELKRAGGAFAPLRPLDTLLRASAEIQRIYGATVQ